MRKQKIYLGDIEIVDSSRITYQTTEPTEDIDDGGIHIVYLEANPSAKYEGYIYLIAE